MKNILKILLLSAGLAADSTTVFLPMPVKLVVMTEEFESYRRIIVSMESSNDTRNLVTEPELTVGESSETFDIVLNVNTPTIYQGKIRRQTGRFHPIDLQVFEKDSSTLVIHGRVNPFEKIVSYKLLGEDQFYFDIYPDLPEQSYAMESTIPGNEKKPVIPSKITPVGIQHKVQSAKLPESIFVLDKSALIQASIISAAIITGFVIFSLIVLFLWKQVTKIPEKGEGAEFQGATVTQLPRETNLQPEHPVQTNQADREMLIRTIMDEKQISYDEASMYLDIKGDNFDASA